MDYIAQLADYGVAKGLIHESDRNYAINALLEVMGMDEPGEDRPALPLAELLKALTDDAVARGLCQDNVVARDLFDT